MNYWSEVLWRLLDSKLKTSLDLVKIQAAIVYLKFIKGARHLTMLFFLLVVFAVVLAVAASFGAAYIIIPLIVVPVMFSQKRWLRASKVDQLLQEALKQ